MFNKNLHLKKIFFIVPVLFFCILLVSFYHLNEKENSGSSSREIVLQFVTYNGYGNNLYIDNVLTGIQTNYDITATSIINIPYDTSFSTKTSGTDTVSPVVSVANIGRNNLPESDSAQIFFMLNNGEYFDSAYIPALTPGQSAEIEFPLLTYNIGSQLYFKIYTQYNPDSVRVNDTLFQYSIFLPGYERNVLVEEFTSNSSPACANNNQELDAFINTNFSNVCAIKYHLGEMQPDSFYMANPAQNNERARYYFIQSVPTALVDGIKKFTIPYGDSLNLYRPYFKRLLAGTPVSINVSDERIEGDSIKATININLISPVQSGNFKLRLAAVERYIYQEAPNGERNFYDVFRRAYPDSNGISISLTAGNQSFQFTYLKESSWVDSMIYSTAFIQNDDTKEILNCAKGRDTTFDKIKRTGKIAGRESDMLRVKFLNNNPRVLFNPIDSIQSTLNIELFEAYFPPLGWKVFNRDGNITFEQYTGVNGPTIGGSRSVIMDFFDYNSPGQKDSMYTKKYTGLLQIDTFRFDYAYAQYGADYIDSLIVKVSTDGGLTFPTEIFRKGGFDLRTAPQTTSFFIPQNNTQWRTFKYSVSNIVGVNSSSANIPGKFTLYQNYPNPFNPSTKIKYDLPYKNFVTLKVYNILGKEITSLVNTEQQAGSYEVTFNGISHPSGVYFYRLNTDGYSDTKRFVLIK